jgi:hypothetical protein
MQYLISAVSVLRTVRIIFENGVIARGNVDGIFDGAPQLKPDGHRTSLANGKFVACQQRGLMHQPVGIVRHAVDTALRDEFSGPVLPLHHFLGCCPHVKRTFHSKDFADHWQEAGRKLQPPEWQWISFEKLIHSLYRRLVICLRIAGFQARIHRAAMNLYQTAHYLNHGGIYRVTLLRYNPANSKRFSQPEYGQNFVGSIQ